MNNAKDFIIEDGILDKYVGTNYDIIIPEGVNEVGYRAFSDFKEVHSVWIPASLTDIAFLYRGLHIVSIGCSEDHPVYTALDGVLYSKDKKTLVAYPDGRVGTFHIPETVERIEKFAFAYAICDTVLIPNSVKTIEWSAFANCEIVSVTLPIGLSVLNKDVFQNCKNLKELHLPESLVEIGEGAFLGCSALKKLMLPSSLKVIRKFAFSSSGIEKMSIPENLEEIDGSAFSGCKGIKELILPDATVRLQGFTFNNCPSLKKVSMSVNVKNITVHTNGEKTYGVCDMRYGLFSNCPKLEEIELRGVYDPEINWGKEAMYEYRDNRAFAGSPKLSRIIATGTPFNMILKDWQYYAIAGYCKARMEGIEIREDVSDSYVKAMKSRKKQLCEKFCDDYNVVACLVAEKLLTSDLKAFLIDRIGGKPGWEEMVEKLTT